MDKIKIIAIMGKSASGKDTIMKELVKRNPSLNEIVSYTTRPQRDYEINTVHYNFITIEEFVEMVSNDEMLEATNFNDWWYGTSINSLKKDAVNIGVFNPEGVFALLESDDILDIDIYYVLAKDKTRLIRQLTREENPNIKEILRRYQTDEKDFLELPDKYIRIENETDGDFLDCLNTIESISLGK